MIMKKIMKKFSSFYSRIFFFVVQAFNALIEHWGLEAIKEDPPTFTMLAALHVANKTKGEDNTKASRWWDSLDGTYKDALHKQAK